MGCVGFVPAQSVAYFFLAGFRPVRFAAAIALRPVAFFLGAGLLEAAFAATALPDFFFGLAEGFFAIGNGLFATGDSSDAMGVVTFTAPFLLLTTDAATAIRRAYFFFIAILVDMMGSCFSRARLCDEFGRAVI